MENEKLFWKASNVSHAETVHQELGRGYQYIHPKGIEGLCCRLR